MTDYLMERLTAGQDCESDMEGDGQMDTPIDSVKNNPKTYKILSSKFNAVERTDSKMSSVIKHNVTKQ